MKITESGTYIVTGTSDNGSITVKKGTAGVVLVLDDLDLTSTSGATLSINKNAEVQVVISGKVTLTDNENPENENSTNAETLNKIRMRLKDNRKIIMMRRSSWEKKEGI